MTDRVREIPLIELLHPRDLTAVLVQEHLDDLAVGCPPDGSIPAALVEVISRMTVAGMEAEEITARLAGVEWALGRALSRTTVQHARQIAAGTKTGEAQARRIVALRSGGKCELGQHTRAEEVAHRISRGRQGAWHPANLLHLCGWHHRFSHAEPDLSYAGGWMVRTGYDPATTPVWLDNHLGPAWYLLDDEGLLRWADVDRQPITVPMPPPIPQPRSGKHPGAHR